MLCGHGGRARRLWGIAGVYGLTIQMRDGILREIAGYDRSPGVLGMKTSHKFFSDGARNGVLPKWAYLDV